MPAAHAYLLMIGTCISCVFNNSSSVPTSEGLTYNIELAVHEACTNIIEHAYSGLPGSIKLEFMLRENPQQLVVNLFDNGRSFEYAASRTPNLDEPQIRGYGLFIIKNLMDTVDYCSDANGNSWHLVKNLA
ncbi:MAG: ATP-binding protein [Anaerolineaceae bacterium]|nr:ATP-binding protein [Anaerolineaceae bacterium]